MKYVQTLVFAAICGFVLTLAWRSGAINPARRGYRGSHCGRGQIFVGRWRMASAGGGQNSRGRLCHSGRARRNGGRYFGQENTDAQAEPLPDRVTTAPDTEVRGLVSYKPAAEQNAIRLTSDTVLAIDKLTVSDTGVDTVSDTELDLRQGGIYCSVKKLSGASQYLIKIPNGIAGVRGTLFYLDVTGKCYVIPRKDAGTGYQNSVVLSIIPPGASRPLPWLWVKAASLIPNSGLISPMPEGLNADVDQIITSLRTLYYGDVNFTFLT